MPRVVHFEIPAKDKAKIQAFYSTVFGWEFTKWEGGDEPYWMVKTGEQGTPGIDGGLYTPDEQYRSVVNTIDVPNLDEYIAKVKANGGTVAIAKMPVPGVGYLCYCKDVEGTLFGLMQADPNAA